MKRYNQLYKQICSMENIVEAHTNAKKGKMHYQEVQKVEASRDRYLQDLQTQLLTKTFKTSEVLNSIMSYYGWLGYADCNNLIKKYFNEDIYSIFNKVCTKEGIANPLRKKK